MVQYRYSFTEEKRTSITIVWVEAMSAVRVVIIASIRTWENTVGRLTGDSARAGSG